MILQLWHERRLMEILTNVTTDDNPRGDDIYERTDKFNSMGLLSFVYCCMKERINATVDEQFRIDASKESLILVNPFAEII